MESRSERFIEAVDAFRAAGASVALGATEDERDAAIENSDSALEVLLSVPSSSSREFGEKLRALELEYGSDWQPRHIAALLGDAALLLQGG
jgi:hypothetical protein